jgi:HSP20 family molecular chaperone IbpA
MQQPDTNVLRYERYDSFQSRSFRVPKTADLSTVSAKYEDGVLTVGIKKRQDVIDSRRTVDIA